MLPGRARHSLRVQVRLARAKLGILSCNVESLFGTRRRRGRTARFSLHADSLYLVMNEIKLKAGSRLLTGGKLDIVRTEPDSVPWRFPLFRGTERGTAKSKTAHIPFRTSAERSTARLDNRRCSVPV